MPQVNLPFKNMNISNKKKTSALKRLFFLVSVFIAAISLILFLIDVLYGIISVGAFSLWYLYFHVADYQYIEFSDEENKVVLRYYKAIRFGRGEYSLIEFPQSALLQANFENSVFGLLFQRPLLSFPGIVQNLHPIEE